MTTPSTRDFRTLSPVERRVAVIAGSGRLPEEIANILAGSGCDPFVVLVEGEAQPAGSLASHDHVFISLERFGDLVPLLKRNRVTHAVLAGGIARRPRWRSVRPSLGLLTFLPKALVALARGDDALLKAVIGHLEGNGIRVVGAHEIAPDLLSRAGAMGKQQPTVRDRRDIGAALEAARAIGALDIGQAAVAIGGRAVALEGIEGTDGLLERVKALRANGRIAGAAGGVLVKCAKPGQELRADLPSIGPASVTAAHAAGLAGIAVEAERSFVLDHAETVARADALGLFVFGFPEGAAR
jgi:DUF1009 family protein